MSGLLYCKNILMWYNKYRKTTAHKVGCRFYSEKKIHPATGKFWGGFLMSGLFAELKYKCQ